MMTIIIEGEKKQRVGRKIRSLTNKLNALVDQAKELGLQIDVKTELNQEHLACKKPWIQVELLEKIWY